MGVRRLLSKEPPYWEGGREAAEALDFTPAGVGEGGGRKRVGMDSGSGWVRGWRERRTAKSSGPRRGLGSSAVIALLLLARELLGHRLDRKLAGPGTLSLNRRECRLVQIRLEPAQARECIPTARSWFCLR